MGTHGSHASATPHGIASVRVHPPPTLSPASASAPPPTPARPSSPASQRSPGQKSRPAQFLHRTLPAQRHLHRHLGDGIHDPVEILLPDRGNLGIRRGIQEVNGVWHSALDRELHGVQVVAQSPAQAETHPAQCVPSTLQSTAADFPSHSAHDAAPWDRIS